MKRTFSYRGRKITVETYVYFHTQTESGYQARKKKMKHGEVVSDRSKYFGIMKHGSLSAAERAARQWSRTHLHSSR